MQRRTYIDDWGQIGTVWVSKMMNENKMSCEALTTTTLISKKTPNNLPPIYLLFKKNESHHSIDFPPHVELQSQH